MAIHSTAIIDKRATLGQNVSIGAFSQVGPDVVLHDEVVLGSHVIVTGCTTIGEKTEVGAFTSLGGAPQHLGYRGEKTELVIGARTSIREHVTMNTGMVSGRSETRVGNDCLFMAGTHIAHDCLVADHVVMANNAGLGGHATIGAYVFLGGLCGIHQFCRVGDFAFVGAAALVTRDVIPYGSVIGNHATLEGVNLVGMRRRDMPRDVINDIRAAYRLLFAPEGTLQERIDDVANLFPHRAEVMAIIGFMKADKNRRLCTPKR